MVLGVDSLRENSYSSSMLHGVSAGEELPALQQLRGLVSPNLPIPKMELVTPKMGYPTPKYSVITPYLGVS